MSSVRTYDHPTHHGHVDYVGGHHEMTHKWAHGGPDVRKSYSSAAKAKAALHRAVKAGNVPLREATETAPTQGDIRDTVRALKGIRRRI